MAYHLLIFSREGSAARLRHAIERPARCSALNLPYLAEHAGLEEIRPIIFPHFIFSNLATNPVPSQRIITLLHIDPDSFSTLKLFQNDESARAPEPYPVHAASVRAQFQVTPEIDPASSAPEVSKDVLRREFI